MPTLSPDYDHAGKRAGTMLGFSLLSVAGTQTPEPSRLSREEYKAAGGCGIPLSPGQQAAQQLLLP